MSENDTDVQELRENTSSGWMELSKREGLEYVVDALLGCPPDHTGTIGRLSERTGVEEDELRDHLKFLERLGVVDVRDSEYTIQDESIVMKELFHLNSALNKVLGESE